MLVDLESDDRDLWKRFFEVARDWNLLARCNGRAISSESNWRWRATDM
jgi:hypothetical protein